MMSESFVFHLDFLGMGGSDVCSMKYLRPFASREIVFPYVFQADHPANPLLRDMMSSYLTSIYPVGMDMSFG